MYDGVEITVRKVIHTEDYRLRLISLRVRPGSGPGWAGRMGAGACLRTPQSTGLQSPLQLKRRPVSSGPDEPG